MTKVQKQDGHAALPGAGMDPVSSENLRSFLGQIKNAGLPERIFSWRRIRSQVEIAIAEYEQLTARIREMGQETACRKEEAVRLQEELGAALEIHEKEIRRLNLLAGVTRHDILNQLAILGAYLTLIETNVNDPQIAHYISKGREAAQGIQYQISYARSYQDIGIQRPVWQNVNDLAGKTVTSFLSHGVPVAVSCPPDLEILADAMLENVFANLMDNSLRYGERVKEIRVTSHKAGDELVIAWEDDGMGIPPDRKEKIFEHWPQHRFDLFLSRQVLEITGITIRETGTWGKGARFEMNVPEGAYRFTAWSDAGSG